MSKLQDKVTSKSEFDALPIGGAKPRNEKEEKHLKEIATYEFHNLEEPGLSITFPYGNTRNKMNFTLQHGQTYSVPRHVARHVESCGKPIWDYRPDGQGRMVKQKIGYNSRFQMRETFGD